MDKKLLINRNYVNYCAQVIIVTLYLILCAYINTILGVLITGIFIFVLSGRVKADKICDYLVVTSILFTFITDFTSANSGTPYWIKYLPEVLAFILFIKVTMEYNYKKDFFLKICLLFFLYSIILNTLTFSVNVLWFDMLRRVFRFVPVYMYISKQGINKRTGFLWRVLFIANFLLFICECLFDVGRDYKNGIFGKTGTLEFEISILAVLAVVLCAYLNKRASLFLTAAITIALFIVLAIAEQKAFLVTTAVYVIIVIMLCSKVTLRKILLVLVAVGAVVVGVKVLQYYFPQFAAIFEGDVIAKLLNTLHVNPSEQLFTMNRFQATEHILESASVTEKIFGFGIGTAFANENIFYFPIENFPGTVLPESELYTKYGSLGYMLSAMNNVRLESGFVGLCLILVAMLMFAIKSFKLIYRQKNKEIGVLYIGLMLAMLYSFVYVNHIFNRNALLLIMIICGLIQYEYENNCRREVI